MADTRAEQSDLLWVERTVESRAAMMVAS
jgi:hypothetical protein